MSKSIILVSTLLLTLVPLLTLATEGVRDCPGMPGFQFVNISGCAKAPCMLPRGKDAEMISGFISCK